MSQGKIVQIQERKPAFEGLAAGAHQGEEGWRVAGLHPLPLPGPHHPQVRRGRAGVPPPRRHQHHPAQGAGNQDEGEGEELGILSRKIPFCLIGWLLVLD